MSWGSSANSSSSDISPPTEAGEIPGNTSEALDMEGDSSDDEGDPALSDDTAKDSQGVEDDAWVPPVPRVTVTLRQPRTKATWTVFQHDDAPEHDPHADTTAMHAAQMGGQVGLKEGLHVTHGRVDILKLWLRLYTGDMHANLRKLNDAGLSKRADFRQVNPAELVRFWGLMVAGTVYGQRGRDLWEINNMLDGIRDQPQFQKYMAFHRFKIIRSLTNIAKQRHNILA
jgi:hypothetical protein